MFDERFNFVMSYDEFCLRNLSDTHLGGMEALLCPGSRDKKLIKSDPAFLPAVSQDREFGIFK